MFIHEVRGRGHEENKDDIMGIFWEGSSPLLLLSVRKGWYRHYGDVLYQISAAVRKNKKFREM